MSVLSSRLRFASRFALRHWIISSAVALLSAALVFGPQWAPAGLIAACLAPWMYAALVISPLSRALSVLQAQQWKLVYDIAAVSLLLLSYALARMLDTSLTGFSLLISLTNILGYGVYAVLLARLIDGKLQGGAHPKEE